MLGVRETGQLSSENKLLGLYYPVIYEVLRATARIPKKRYESTIMIGMQHMFLRNGSIDSPVMIQKMVNARPAVSKIRMDLPLLSIRFKGG